MGEAPAGRLHKRLTEKGLAATTFAFSEGLADPGFALFGAQLGPAQEVDAARRELLATLESVAGEPITAEELERARTKWLKGWEMAFTNPETVGISLSESVAQGDWRLFFLTRDRVRDVTLERVQRVAEQRLLESNRTLGVYLPSDKPQRAPEPARVDVVAEMKTFKPQSAAAAVEAFEATPANIEQRTQRFEAGGVKVALLPKGTRVYVAHIEGTPIEDMVATAKRIAGEGFDVMPHFPARIIKDKATLADWIARYQGEANVRQALLLAGGVTTPHGDYHSSMQLLESGQFDGFDRLHVAGHPEGNKDIDKDGGDAVIMQALAWKQAFANTSDAKFAIATQFCFEADPVIAWANKLSDAGISMPIHIGIAGPAKLQTLIKFAIACGVGPSLRVLQKRAMDVTKLLLPYEPTEVAGELAAHKAATPGFNIEQVHFFPLGGIKTNAQWVTDNGGAAGLPVNA